MTFMTFYNCSTRKEYIRNEIFIGVSDFFFFPLVVVFQDVYNVEEFPVRQKKKGSEEVLRGSCARIKQKLCS